MALCGWTVEASDGASAHSPTATRHASACSSAVRTDLTVPLERQSVLCSLLSPAFRRSWLAVVTDRWRTFDENIL